MGREEGGGGASVLYKCMDQGHTDLDLHTNIWTSVHGDEIFYAKDILSLDFFLQITVVGYVRVWICQQDRPR